MRVLFPTGIAGVPIYPGGYAMLGAGALVGGVTQSFAVTFVLMELTGSSFHFPTLVGTITAIYASNTAPSLVHITKLYDIIKKTMGLVPEAKTAEVVEEITMVHSIMEKTVKHIRFNISPSRAGELLTEFPDIQRYPVVDNEQDKFLIGVAEKKDLEAYARFHGVSFPEPEKRKNTKIEEEEREEEEEEDLVVVDMAALRERQRKREERRIREELAIPKTENLEYRSLAFTLSPTMPLNQARVLFTIFNVEYAYVVTANGSRLIGELTIQKIQEYMIQNRLSVLGGADAAATEQAADHEQMNLKALSQEMKRNQESRVVQVNDTYI